MSWQSMNTAPRDRRVLLWSPKYREQFVAFHATCPDDGDEQWVIARSPGMTFIVPDPAAWRDLPDDPELSS